MSDEVRGWTESAGAWIESQGEEGDRSRRDILDPAVDRIFGNCDGKEILDVGCGEGRYSRKLARFGANVVGIDPTLPLVERACRLHPQGSYILGSGERLPFASARFDWVLSYLTLCDIKDHRAASTEMCRVLKKDGRLLIVMISNMSSPSTGWYKDAQGNKLHRAVDRYMEEFALDLEWSGIRIRNFHRPLSALLQPFLEAGMVMDQFEEPLPEPGSAGYAQEFRCPCFQIIGLRNYCVSA